MAREYVPEILAIDADSIDTAHKALTLLKRMEQELTADEAVIRYARRALALYKNQARHASGVAADRRYTPDMSKVEDSKVLESAAVYLEGVAQSYIVPGSGAAAEAVEAQKIEAAPKAEQKAVKARKAKADKAILAKLEAEAKASLEAAQKAAETK